MKKLMSFEQQVHYNFSWILYISRDHWYLILLATVCLNGAWKYNKNRFSTGVWNSSKLIIVFHTKSYIFFSFNGRGRLGMKFMFCERKLVFPIFLLIWAFCYYLCCRLLYRKLIISTIKSMKRLLIW